MTDCNDLPKLSQPITKVAQSAVSTTIGGAVAQAAAEAIVPGPQSTTILGVPATASGSGVAP